MYYVIMNVAFEVSFSVILCILLVYYKFAYPLYDFISYVRKKRGQTRIDLGLFLFFSRIFSVAVALPIAFVYFLWFFANLPTLELWQYVNCFIAILCFIFYAKAPFHKFRDPRKHKQNEIVPDDLIKYGGILNAGEQE
jgi:hypothetical protein